MTAGPLRFLAAACLLAGLTACAALPLGNAPAKPALSDAPRVPDSRDLRGTPVCDLLTPAELERFGLDPATATYAEVAETDICRYRGRDGLRQASVTSAARWDPGGLDRLYLNREFAEIFEPGILDGFPSVVTDANRADLCDLNVGVADDQLMIVTAAKLTGSTAPHSCDQARAIASAVLSHLPPLR